MQNNLFFFSVIQKEQRIVSEGKIEGDEEIPVKAALAVGKKS